MKWNSVVLKLTLKFRGTVYNNIRTVSKLFAFVVSFAELVLAGSFGQRKINSKLDFYPDQPGRNQMYQN